MSFAEYLKSAALNQYIYLHYFFSSKNSVNTQGLAAAKKPTDIVSSLGSNASTSASATNSLLASIGLESECLKMSQTVDLKKEPSYIFQNLNLA